MAKAPADIRSLARSHTSAALNTLVRIANDMDAPEAAQVAASNSILDRGWGKPNQIVDMTVKKRAAKELSDDELADIAIGSGKGASDSSDDT